MLVSVVADTAADCGERFPAASYAATLYEYDVAGVRPVFAYVVPTAVATWVPFL